MSARYDCTDVAQRAEGLSEAAAALRKGELAVLPTDTVYGVAADAFSPAAVGSLLAAKGRDRQAPPPVLVGTVRAALALVEDVDAAAKDLIDEFWPGGLTLVFRANRSLAWDLGDTRGTVAVRMPLHPVALALLKDTGPLAVSSANRSGELPATTVAGAEAQLGDSVAVYLDGGPCLGDVPSTIVDVTGPVPRLLRQGVIPVERLRDVVAMAVDEDDAGAGFQAGQTPPAWADAAEADTVGDGAVGGGARNDAAEVGTAGDGAVGGGVRNEAASVDAEDTSGLAGGDTPGGGTGGTGVTLGEGDADAGVDGGAGNEAASADAGDTSGLVGGDASGGRTGGAGVTFGEGDAGAGTGGAG